MQGTFTTQNPEEIKMTLKIVGTLKEFQQLKEQLSHNWPSSDLSTMLGDVIRQANEVFYEEQKAGS